MYPRDIQANDFITHTEPAVRALFDAIREEEARYTAKKKTFESVHEMHYMDFITADLSEDFDDRQIQHKFTQAAEAKIQAILISQSIEVLCGAVLQIAKQGISLVLKGLDRYIRGRYIESQNLSNIIWHGRNQAMHWEDGVPTNKHTKDCFETLAKEVGPQFEFGESPRNMAWDVWNAIGWSTYEDYGRDIREVLEK